MISDGNDNVGNGHTHRLEGEMVLVGMAGMAW